MTTAGWIFMLSSWSIIIYLTVFSFWKILSKPSPKTK